MARNATIWQSQSTSGGLYSHEISSFITGSGKLLGRLRAEEMAFSGLLQDMRVTVEGPKTLFEMVSLEDTKRKYHSHSVEIREILSKDTNTVRKIWEQSTVDISTSLRFRPLQINKPVHNSDCLCRWCVRSSVC